MTLAQTRAAVEARWPDLLAATMPATFSGARRDNYLTIKPIVTKVTTRSDEMTRRLYTRPLILVLGLTAGVLGIACVNLAGLMLARLGSRTHDMGVQLALGAPPWHVARQIVWEGLLVSSAGSAIGVLLAPTVTGAAARLLGIAIGMAPAFVAVRLVRSLLVGVTPHDPLTTALAPALLLVSAVAACLVPAVRAARVDVIRALRAE